MSRYWTPGSGKTLFEERLCCEKGGSSGGGGSSGRVDYPAYIKNSHKWLLNGMGADGTGGVTGAIETAKLDNPYDALNNPDWATAVDPDGYLSSMDTALAKFSPATDPIAGLLDSFVASAVGYWDNNVVTSTHTNAAVNDFALRQFNQYSKALNRFRANMSGIGAVNTSAFAIGEALITAEHTRAISDFQSDIEIKHDTERSSGILQYADLLSRIQNFLYDAQREAARMGIETERIKLTAKSEEQTQNLEIDSRDALWEIELYQKGANVLAAHSGGTVSTGRSQSKLGTALGGALLAASLMSSFGNPAGSTLGIPGGGKSYGAVTGGSYSSGSLSGLGFMNLASGGAGKGGGVGQSVGGTAGSVAGGLIGTIVSAGNPAGTAVGSSIGNAIGSALGSLF